MGKTVHFRYLSYLRAINRWKENSFHKLLLNIEVRKVKSKDDIYDTIIKQNFKNIHYITKNLLKIIMKENYENIIIFIDGADELEDKNNKINKCII